MNIIRKQRKKISIKKRFSFILIIILLLLIVLSVFVFHSILKIFINSISLEISYEAQIISEEVNQFLAIPEEQLKNIRSRLNKPISSISDNNDIFIDELINIIKAFQFIILLDKNGRIKNIRPYKQDYLGIDMSNQEYFKKAIDNIGINWSNSFISSETGNPTITLSTRYNEGVIVIFYNLEYLSKFIDIHINYESDFIAVIDDKGDIVGHTDYKNVLNTINLSNMEIVNNTLNELNTEVKKELNIKTSIDYYNKIKGITGISRVKNKNFYVIIFRSYNNILSALTELYFIYYIIIGVIVFIIILIILTVFKITLKPIDILTNNIQDISNGNYNININTKYFEFENLIRNFKKMAHDISKRESDLEISIKEKDTLLMELYHRTKNHMQMIISLLQLQANNINNKNITVIFNDMENRINSLILIQHMLYQSKNLISINFREFTLKFITLISNSFNKKNLDIIFDININKINLNVDIAIPCALVINELLTNSYKYAFQDKKSGKISITMKKSKKDEIEFYYRDNGIGLPESFDYEHTKSMGFFILIKLVKNQLQGTFLFSGKNGFEYSMRFRNKKIERI